MGFKFYHGTSTLFLDSIRKKGLGGINPNTEFKNLEVLKFLAGICEKNIANTSDYKVFREATLAMVNQVSSDMDYEGKTYRVNFSHEGIYVSMSKVRAARYAAMNKYGSEILERIIILHNILKKYSIDFKVPDSINLFDYEKVIGIETKPIIVMVNGIEHDRLVPEVVFPEMLSLRALEFEIENWSEKDRFEKLQFYNFRILEAVPISNLAFYELDYEGIPESKDFQIFLSKL